MFSGWQSTLRQRGSVSSPPAGISRGPESDDDQIEIEKFNEGEDVSFRSAEGVCCFCHSSYLLKSSICGTSCERQCKPQGIQRDTVVEYNITMKEIDLLLCSQDEVYKNDQEEEDARLDEQETDLLMLERSLESREEQQTSLLDPMDRELVYLSCIEEGFVSEYMELFGADLSHEICLQNVLKGDTLEQFLYTSEYTLPESPEVPRIQSNNKISAYFDISYKTVLYPRLYDQIWLGCPVLAALRSETTHTQMYTLDQPIVLDPSPFKSLLFTNTWLQYLATLLQFSYTPYTSIAACGGILIETLDISATKFYRGGVSIPATAAILDNGDTIYTPHGLQGHSILSHITPEQFLQTGKQFLQASQYILFSNNNNNQSWYGMYSASRHNIQSNQIPCNYPMIKSQRGKTEQALRQDSNTRGYIQTGQVCGDDSTSDREVPLYFDLHMMSLYNSTNNSNNSSNNSTNNISNTNTNNTNTNNSIPQNTMITTLDTTYICDNCTCTHPECSLPLSMVSETRAHARQVNANVLQSANVPYNTNEQTVSPVPRTIMSKGPFHRGDQSLNMALLTNNNNNNISTPSLLLPSSTLLSPQQYSQLSSPQLTSPSILSPNMNTNTTLNTLTTTNNMSNMALIDPLKRHTPIPFQLWPGLKPCNVSNLGVSSKLKKITATLEEKQMSELVCMNIHAYIQQISTQLQIEDVDMVILDVNEHISSDGSIQVCDTDRHHLCLEHLLRLVWMYLQYLQ